MVSCISDIEHVFYINLDRRPDRKVHIERQLNNIGIQNPTRFKAIQMANGAIGCSMSHLKCLQTAKESGWSHVLICEDDALFLNPPLFTRQLNKFLNNKGSDASWDVLLLAGNNVPPYKVIDDTCVQVSKCQTTTAYFVQSHYFDTLIDNIKTGLMYLMLEPEKHVLYAIDKYWFQLQAVNNWLLIVPLTVTQREDYSDIEKRPTNYTNVMLDLDKPWIRR